MKDKKGYFNKFSIIIILLLLFVCYKLYTKENKTQSSGIESEIENRIESAAKALGSSKNGDLNIDDILKNATEALGSDEKGNIKIDDFLNDVKDGDLMGSLGSFLEGIEDNEEVNEMLDDMLKNVTGMSDNEIEVLESLPPSNYSVINSENQARELLTTFETLDLDQYINAKSSKHFKEEINKVKTRGIGMPKNIIRKAERAKDYFNRKNPNFNFGEDVGSAYTSDEKLVYLPLGEKSFADEVVDYRKNNQIRYPMENSLGPPNCQGSSVDYIKTITNLGLGGQLTLKFTDNALVDIKGIDLYVFEIGAIEPTLLEVSENGENWIEVGQIKGGTAGVDIEGKVEKGVSYKYVRLTDLKHKSSIPGADIDAVAAIGSVIKLELNAEVLFDFGKSDLSAEGEKSIEDLASQLKGIKNAKVSITGHTDDIGSDTTNEKLSFARAKSVSAAVQNSLGSSQLKFDELGQGESSPIFPNDTEENRKKNRRVEITVIPL